MSNNTNDPHEAARYNWRSDTRGGKTLAEVFAEDAERRPPDDIGTGQTSGWNPDGTSSAVPMGSQSLTIPNPLALYNGLYPLTPAGYRLLVKLPEKTGKTASGIVIPDKVEDREHAGSMFGQVVLTGPDA